jgi:hypothetical protein
VYASQPTIRTRNPSARRPCLQCDGHMMITRIEPDIRGYNLCTLECTRCGDETVSTIASARLGPLGWAQPDSPTS